MLDIIPTTEGQAASGYPARNEYTAAAGVHSLREWSPCYSFSSYNMYYTFLDNIEHFEMYKKMYKYVIVRSPQTSLCVVTFMSLAEAQP